MIDSKASKIHKEKIMTNKAIRNQIKEAYGKMTREQFKDFAFGWIEEEAIEAYLNGIINMEENTELLVEWLNYTLRCLRVLS